MRASGNPCAVNTDCLSSHGENAQKFSTMCDVNIL